LGEAVMLNQMRKARIQGSKADNEEFNVSKLEATLCISASALATIGVLIWVVRTFLTAVL
jgi:hypothetical protein